jgi:hypothetical protein
MKLKSLLIPIITLLPLAGTVLQAQSTPPPRPKTTAVLVILTEAGRHASAGHEGDAG